MKRRMSTFASLALVAALVPALPAAAAAEAPALTPSGGALVNGTVPAHAEATDSPVTELALDDAAFESQAVMSGEPFEFVFEGDGLNTRYINGIEVRGNEVYTLGGAGGFATVQLPVQAKWLSPGENEITLFTGSRPGICNMDDFTVRNARLRLPDGTEVYDDTHPSDEEITLGDGTCGSNTTRPREVTYTFTLPDDAGTGPLGVDAEIDTTALADGPHGLSATTADGGTTSHTVWTDNTLTDPEQVSVLLPEASPAAEQTVEAEQLLPPVDQDISVAEQFNCCSVRFDDEAQLLAGRDSDDFGPPQDGSSFTLDVPVEASGRYKVALDVTTAPDYGTFTVSLNGDQLGRSYDAYSETVAVDRRVLFGVADLEAGIAQLTVTASGANPASTGRLIGLDVVRLQPVPLERDILSPTDGAVVRGQVPVVGYTADTHPRTLSIDGANAGPRQLLGGASASLVYEGGGGNGIQNAFANRIAVRGHEISIRGTVQNWTEDAVDIPAELLQPGENTVTFKAGLNSGCNHDDFDLRNVRLELPDGTVLTDPTVEGQRVVFGDGTCDTSVGGRSKALEYDFTFTIPEPSEQADYQPGMGTVWDTTQAGDGEHTVALAHRDGTTTTNTVTVDNTAPEILSTVPADGSELKGVVTLAAEATDATSGVAETTVTIDGREHPVGEALSSDDLEDGTHEMVVTVTDQGGNETSTTVEFTSIAESPDVEALSPEDGATDVDTSPSLRVRAVDPAGDPLDVTFYEALLGEPAANASWSGATESIPPAGLDSTSGTPIESVQDAIRPDDVYLDSPASGEFPFQRFDLPVPDGEAGNQSAEPLASGEAGNQLEISWEGKIDGAREIILSAYDLAAGQWQELDRHRGDPDGGDLRLQVPVTEELVDDGVVHVLLQGNDPFADDIEDVPDEKFRDPDSYDFSIAWMTDTQYLSEGAVADGAAADRFAAAYRSMTDWIAENGDEHKIDYVAHTGDVVNNWITIDDESDGYAARAREEFGFASETMAVLEDAGIPYGVTPGNHDNKFGTANEMFNEFFPPSRFEEASQRAEQDYFGGAWRENDYHNHYDLFSAGGQDFIVLYLGFIAGDEEIQWANDVLAEHSDRNAIFATHEYLMPSMQADGRDGPLSNENARSQGTELFEEVVLPNENVFLTLSGHTHGVALNIKRDVGSTGRTVVEMLANYQFFELGGQRRTGHMRLLQFDLDRSELSVNTYSPVIDDHNAEEFDTNYNRDYTAEADEFTVPVDLNTRSTQFSTDAVYLAARTDDEIGAASVDASGEASATWEGLDGGARYGWYATADDGLGGVTETTTSTFTTADALEVGVTIEPAEPDGDNGWYASPVTVTAVASEDHATVEFNVDSAGWVADADGALVVDADGEHTVEVRAVSGDEVTDARSVDLSIDATPPALDVEGITDGQEFIAGVDDEITWSFDDATAGVGAEEVSLDGERIDDELESGGPFLPGDVEPGEHQLEIRIADEAGHATTQSFEFTVGTAPEWSRRTVYRKDDVVTWEGTVYVATRRTRGVEPGVSPRGPWQEIAVADEDGVAPWSDSRVYRAGDVVRHDGELWEATRLTRSDEPGARPNGPWQPSEE